MRYSDCMFKLPEMPAIKFPSIDFSAVDFPSIDFPSIDFSRLDVSALRDVDLAKYVTDAAYITVGLGVVAVEKAQARSEQIAATITEFTKVAREQVRARLHTAA
jgi:hypothetical protein